MHRTFCNTSPRESEYDSSSSSCLPNRQSYSRMSYSSVMHGCAHHVPDYNVCCHAVLNHCPCINIHNHHIQSQCCRTNSNLCLPVPNCSSPQFRDRNVPNLRPNFAVCSYCGNEGKFVCNNCNEPYCSRVCQEADWLNHKVFCHEKQFVNKGIPNQTNRNSLSSDFSSNELSDSSQNQRSSTTSKPKVDNTRKLSKNVKVPRNFTYQNTHLNFDHQKHRKRTNISRNDHQFNEPSSDSNTLTQINKISENQNIGKSSIEKINHNPKSDENELKSNENEIPSILATATTKSDFDKRPLNSTIDNLLVLDKKKALSVKHTKLANVEKVIVTYLNSPSEFWIQRFQDKDILDQINKEMTILIESRTFFHSPEIGDLCGTFCPDRGYCRAHILKVFQDDTCEVFFIDYGHRAKIKKSDLCYLTSNLGNYPALAVKCSLAGIEPNTGDGEWLEDSIDFFITKVFTNKVLDLYVIEEHDFSYSVELTDKGINIAYMLIQQNFANSAIQASQVNSKWNKKAGKSKSRCNKKGIKIPSILEHLKVNEKYYAQVVFNKSNDICVWIQHEEIMDEFLEMMKELPTSKSDMASMNEGELVAAFSPVFQGWYRGFILKKETSSFLVHYIDYGNKEEVSELKVLLPKYMKVCSPSLNIIFENEADYDAFTKLPCLDQQFEITIKKVTKKSASLEMSFPQQSFVVDAVPWSNNLKDSSPVNNTLIKSQVLSNSERFKRTGKIMVEPELNFKEKNEVVVSWVESRKRIYLQRICDLEDISELQTAVNSFYNFEDKPTYVPIEGEIVCARYSEDKTWNRSLIVKVLPEDKFIVFFVDFGNIEEILLDDIRYLEDQFLIPVFSICVSLYNVPLSMKLEDLRSRLVNHSFEAQIINTQIKPKEVILYENGTLVFGNLGMSDENGSACNPSPIALPSISHSVIKKDELEIKLTDFENANVRLEHFDLDKNIYVHLISKDELFQSMEKDLEKVWHKCPLDYHPAIDDVVCVLHNNYCKRGYIVDVQGEFCSVKLIDHGPILEIVIIDIVPLPRKFLLPLFALYITLDGVSKSSLTENICKMLKNNYYKLELLDKETEPFKCKLYINDVCINDQFVEESTDINPNASVHISSLTKSTLPINEAIVVTFVHFDEHFYYLQKVSDLEAAGELSQNLQEYCNTALPLSTEPSSGEILCAKYNSDTWYRVCIENVHTDQNKCEVTFIDYGNRETVLFDDLRAISKDLTQFPIFCSKVEVINKKEESIHLYSPVAIQTSGSLEKPLVSILPEKSIRKKNAKKSHTNEFQKDPLSPFMINDCNRVNFPLGKINVHITCVLSVAYVFCMPYNESDILANDNLVKKITAFVNNNDECLYKPIVEGELVLAQIEENKLWYRGAVIELTDEYAEIYFVDNGKGQKTRFENIRKMDEQFVNHPVQGLVCSLQGFSCDKNNEQKIIDVLSRNYLYTKLEALHFCENGEDIIEIPLIAKALVELGIANQVKSN